MIKIGIAGADNPVAGELLRLCLHHPDIDIVSAYAPKYAGHSVSAVHPGFIGEQKILFTSNLDVTSLDVAFIFDPVYSETDWSKLMSDNSALRLIIFPGAEQIATGLPRDPIFGLSEINRKPLVRGAREAVVPEPISVAVLTALYPLARHLILSGDLKISVSAPGDIISPERLGRAQNEIKRELSKVQTSFQGNVIIEVADSKEARAMEIKISLPTSTPIDEAMKIYDSIYDDHNFTYVVTHPVGKEEIWATNKVIIQIAKNNPASLDINVVADPRMRGGAGEAMHIMNLMLGLHEKTGLDLKTTYWK